MSNLSADVIAAHEALSRLNPAVVGFDQKYDVAAASIYPINYYSAIYEGNPYRMKIMTNPLRLILETMSNSRNGIVLLIDDEIDNQEDLLEALARHHYQPAVQYLRAGKVDKLLM